ncbi:hypothetical protein NX722_03040 [Endozoicomonas gorgoniicola]|uniref:Uncharacterized protein n=1 Tax=Endozoicomonas gorgoniicola TaxID=1234144 RepID=A0ABT3MQH7_9GAMM|nr:hypothetical protein [Endozoicomonas gorgoniicola]MCW7551636.1 hypothetical protein [Endozoicomonas gorgoniicola]
MPNDLNMDLRHAKEFIERDEENLSGIHKDQVRYASLYMLTEISKRIIHHKNIEQAVNLHKRLDSIEGENKRWSDEYNNRIEKINGLSAKLIEYETGYNFVALYKGFSDIAEEKKKELSKLFLSLIVMGIIIILPLALEITYIFKNIDIISSKKEALLLMLLPIASLEIILIYFFRIILMNYKSVKAQLLQIDLRKTLCQFIQSYADYAKDIREKSSTSLEKFESIIFSGILTTDENLPSTFDGLEQIIKAVKAAKPS